MLPPRLISLLVLSAVAALTLPEESSAQSTLIPLTTRRDMVFDFSGQHLYISTSDGFVRRYNVSTLQLETSYNLGGSLNGMDIDQGDSFLLVAQNTVSGSQGTVHKVNLSTGGITNINYTRDFGEGGAWDVAIGSNGLALVTTNFQGSGTTPVHQIILATNAISVRNDAPGSFFGQVSNNTQIHRSADGARLYFLEDDLSGPIFTYSASTNTFGPNAQMMVRPSSAAVNRNGTVLGTRLSSNGTSLDTAPNFNYAHNFSAPNGGVAFDAQNDTFYAVKTSTNQIFAYNTNIYTENSRLNIGESIGSSFTQFGAGPLVASPDGVHLALATPSGVRVFDVTMGTAPSSPTFGRSRDMVFDHVGHYLYITTAEGLVWPYNLSTSTLGIPFDLGGSLNAVDIAADDSFLLVAQGNSGLTQGVFQKVDLVTGTITNAGYTRASGEGGALDVAIASNGLALGSTIFAGSGWTPLHQIDLTTNAVTNRGDAPGSGGGGTVNWPTEIHRSADRTRFYFLEGNISSGPRFTYNAVSDTFGASSNLNTSLSNATAAVNRNGMLLATGISGGTSLETASDFTFVHSFNTLDSGIAFDAIHDTVYGINSSIDQIIAYDTNTFAEKFRFAIGENLPSGATLFGPGTFVASQDGHYLALITPTTLRVFAVPPVPLVSVTSRMTQGSAMFDINLPLDGTPGVECRFGGANGDYTVVVIFSTAVTFGNASVTSGSGMVTSTSGSGSTAATILLTGVSNAQTIKVSLPGVNNGTSTTNLVVPMSILIGDTTGNGTVTSSDVSQVKLQSGQLVTSSNFRADVNASGAITSTDVSSVKSRTGAALPSN